MTLAAALVGGGVVAVWAFVGSWSSGGSGPEGSSGASQEAAGEAPTGNAGEVPPRDEADGSSDTTVPAGDGEGSIHETVETDADAASDVAEPVGIGDTATFGNGVSARLTAVEAVEAEAHLPGEFSGPAVALTIEVTNGSSGTIDLGTVTADLTFGEGLSAYPVLDPERRPFSGELASGDAASGSYVFTLDPAERADVALRLSYTTEVPTVIFAGSVADG